MSKFLRVKDVAVELQIGRTKAYELVRSGQIPSFRVGGHGLRVRRSDLDDWVARQLGDEESNVRGSGRG